MNQIIQDRWNYGAMPVAFRGGEGEGDEAAKAAADKAATDAKAKADADDALKLGDAGKAALKAERDARAVAEKAHKDAAAELETLRKEKADAAAAKAAADEEEAKRKGEFETLAEKRKAEADAAKADAESKGARLARAETALTAFLGDRIKALEAMKDADLSAEFAAITDPLDQLDWFGKASVKRAMADAAEGKKVDDASKRTRVPETPKQNGTGKHEIKPQPVAY
jgi:colicin import membrane protein